MTSGLVSVVMPAYNAAPYIAEAVASVIAQTYRDWELVVVDDGSTDGTGDIVRRFNDPRIRVLRQENAGIGSARNRALDIVRGQFLCLLDADDLLPPRSIEARVRRLVEDPGASFCDGRVLVYDRQLRNVIREYMPTFEGEPFEELVALRSSCFFGPSWLIRWDPDSPFRFNERISHAEDLQFYLQMAPGRRYVHTREVVLHYRVTGHSTMSDLGGLERSYHAVHRWLRNAHPELPRQVLSRTKWRIRRIMSGSYLRKGRPWKALLAWFR